MVGAGSIKRRKILVDDHLRLHLPEELMIEVLVRLPAKSLLRFKSACRSLLALIRNSEFVHRHATLLEDNSKLGTFIFQLRITSPVVAVPKFLSVSGNYEFNLVEDLGAPPYYLDPDKEPRRVDMVGSCHGIICLYLNPPRDVSLWNPATKQFRLLPTSLTYHGLTGHHVHDFIAFGFDVETKDYKVLLVSCTNPRVEKKDLPRQVQLYSLRTDSWRCLDIDFPFYPVTSIFQGQYLDGNCFLLVDRGICLSRLVLLFDFSKEIFRRIELPDLPYNFSNGGGHYWLVLKGEKLGCLLPQWENKLKYKDYSREVHVWELNNNINHESYVKEYLWTKVCTIAPLKPLPYSQDIDPHPAYTSFNFSKNGEFLATVISSNKVVQLFNTITQEIKEFQLSEGKSVEVDRISIYKQSLVPLT